MKRCLVFLFVLGSALQARAEVLTPARSLEVLNRIVNAARSLDYTGTYVYQRGNQVDSYQLVHLFDDKGEAERRESLDGPPKVMLREGERITCYMPDAKYVNLDRHSVTKLFPALLPDNPAELLKVYNVHLLGDERVAAIDSQVLLLEPRDGFRYPFKLWYDPESGLMLRAAVMQNRQGQLQAIEQFSFTQLQIGGNVSRKLLKPNLREADFRAYNEQHSAPRQDPDEVLQDWEIRNVPTGFHLVKVVKRTSGRGQLTHMIFTDGLSTVSLFIEPLNPKQKPMQGLSVKDSTYLYARPVGSYQLTVLGDAPEATVMQFASGVLQKAAK